MPDSMCCLMGPLRLCLWDHASPQGQVCLHVLFGCVFCVGVIIISTLWLQYLDNSSG